MQNHIVDLDLFACWTGLDLISGRCTVLLCLWHTQWGDARLSWETKVKGLFSSTEKWHLNLLPYFFQDWLPFKTEERTFSFSERSKKFCLLDLPQSLKRHLTPLGYHTLMLSCSDTNYLNKPTNLNFDPVQSWNFSVKKDKTEMYVGLTTKRLSPKGQRSFHMGSDVSQMILI